MIEKSKLMALELITEVANSHRNIKLLKKLLQTFIELEQRQSNFKFILPKIF